MNAMSVERKAFYDICAYGRKVVHNMIHEH